MNILVINCGSSSLKYQLIDMDNEKELAKGLAERIGIEGSRVKHEVIGKEKVIIEKPMPDHKRALEIVIESLADDEIGAIKSMDEIGAVGHRVVHGGENFTKSEIIDDKVMEGIRECIDIAPLHNPPNIMGIEACQEIMPNVPMVAVFDTAFHQTMPKVSYLYALPYELYEKYGIRRYGAHGTSHNYVSHRAAEILGKDLKDLKMVTCHLGNGSSVSAVKDGKCLDTSMGFTPLEGLIMGTRTGDIDPAIVPFVMQKENLNPEEMSDLLNKKSGVLGISGISSDFRDVENEAEKGNERAQLALDMFKYSVLKYVGAYTAAMNGVDAIVFTAGVGENSPEDREYVCDALEYLGVKIDSEKNKVRGKETIISTDDSKVKVLVVPTNEELMIARDTLNLVK
ncbi:MAG: acetate kinase [Andreesenia angusta]|nr:acetate kinase [Andreesenia angusta]